MRFARIVLALLVAVGGLIALPAGHNTYMLRGKRQDFYFLPAQGRAPRPYAVLFLPGDAGWAGHSVEMAKRIAGLGYNVYGFDVKTYLTSFTGETVLTEREMGEDMRSVIGYVHVASGQPVIAAGWSQGANMSVLGAAYSKADPHCKGALAIGLGTEAVLGWRFVDNLTYITKKQPNEPTFAIEPHVKALSPLPLVLVSSMSDEYVPLQVTDHLIAVASQPKRAYRIPAGDHRFSGKRDDFYSAVAEGLAWIETVRGIEEAQ